MENKIILIGILSLTAMMFLAGCTKSNTYSSDASAPTVASGDVESSSSAVESSAGSFVNDATPTDGQEAPDLS